MCWEYNRKVKRKNWKQPERNRLIKKNPLTSGWGKGEAERNGT